MTIREAIGTAYLLAPLLGGGVFHALCMKYDWLAPLKRPIDYGRTAHGRRIFGANKTFRGPVAVGIGAAIVLGLQATILHRSPELGSVELFDYGAVNGWVLGFLVGMAAMLAELPNSFLKRQLGVGSGERAQGPLVVVFYVLDQVDLLIGAWAVLAFVVDVRVVWVLFSLALVVVVHQLLTSITFAIGMRESPW